MVRAGRFLYPAGGVAGLAPRERDFATMPAAIAQLNTHLLRHLLVTSIVLGMLLVPSTCANAAGPHSIFMTPLAADNGSMHHAGHDPHAGMAMAGMSAEEHALHMLLMGSAEPADPTPASDDSATSPATIQGDAPVEETGVRLSDLPSTMAMVAISNPVTIAELDAIQFPPSPVALPHSPLLIAGRAVSLELPPPRLI